MTILNYEAMRIVLETIRLIYVTHTNPGSYSSHFPIIGILKCFKGVPFGGCFGEGVIYLAEGENGDEGNDLI